MRENRAVTAVKQFLSAWWRRLVELGFVERGVALGSYAFTALVPLLMVYGAAASELGGEGFDDRLSNRLELKGSAAASVHDAFAPPGAVADSLTVLSVLILVGSSLTLTRGLQRLYDAAYELPALGMRKRVAWGLLWLALIPAYVEVRALVSLVFGGLLEAAVDLGVAAVVWTGTPWILLGRRLPWRELLPGGAVAALAMSAVAVGGVIYLPHSVGVSAARFGAIGVAFAILGWLIACGFALVGAAAAGGVLARRGE